MHKPGIYEKYIKRLLDIICALLAITVFSWLYLILIILGAIFMRGNPFFTQERPGRNEKLLLGHIFLTSFAKCARRKIDNFTNPENVEIPTFLYIT